MFCMSQRGSLVVRHGVGARLKAHFTRSMGVQPLGRQNAKCCSHITRNFDTVESLLTVRERAVTVRDARGTRSILVMLRVLVIAGRLHHYMYQDKAKWVA